MGHVSASCSVAHTKLTITKLHGVHDPHAWEQSGRLDPATCSVSSFFPAAPSPPLLLPAAPNDNDDDDDDNTLISYSSRHPFKQVVRMHAR